MNRAFFPVAGSTDILKIETKIEKVRATLNFNFKGYRIIEVGVLKGIVIHFSNNIPEDPCLVIEGTGRDLNFLFDVDNRSLKWKSNQQIRIMYMNERDTNAFDDILHYFQERLNYYKYEDAGGALIDYEGFSALWNVYNPKNQINETKCPAAVLIPRQTHNDDILRIQ
jgi:hypothetical protein